MEITLSGNVSRGSSRPKKNPTTSSSGILLQQLQHQQYQQQSYHHIVSPSCLGNTATTTHPSKSSPISNTTLPLPPPDFVILHTAIVHTSSQTFRNSVTN